MKAILLLTLIAAVAFAAVIEIPLNKDVQINNPEGSGLTSVHKTDSYQTSCCSASNSYYIYAGFDISSLAGAAIESAEIQFAEFLAASAAQSFVAPPFPYIVLDLFNTTSFRESPPYTDRNDAQLPVSDQTIGRLNVTVATKRQNSVIDVTSVIKDAITAGKTGFYFGYGNSGGYSASVTVAAREANAKAIVIKVTTKAATVAPTTEPPVQATTCAPCPCGSQPGKRRSGCPVCKPCTTVAPTTTEPPVQGTTCAPCPCGSRAGKRRNGCPVCLECTTTAAPTTTKAPTTAAPTTEPPVQATTCAPCPCGSSPGKRRNGCPVCHVCTTTKAPTTAAPTTTKAPTTAAPTTEPPVQATTCAPCPCGSRAGKRRNGCPVCLECTTTAAPTTTKAPTTTEPPVKATSTTAPPSSTAQISGDNNARANGAVETFIAASAVLVAAIAML